jgi:capsular polysaccharide biosynthesis protein
MSERLDLRRSVQIVRRHKVLVGLVTILGLLAGAAYAVLNPSMVTSTALVVLPQSQLNSQAALGATSPFTATQVVIADSTPVLSAALPNVRPATSLSKLRSEIKVSSLTSYIISVSAASKVAADAEAMANAVANSYIAYVDSASNPLGRVPASILQPATTATGTKPLEARVIAGLLGALAGALIGVILALAINRNDRRLRERDEIAGSIGLPVLASFPVGHPSDAKGWTKLLEGYEPGALYAWRLRQVLHQLRMVDGNLNNGGRGGRSSLAVLSLSSDPGALAIGPQLAVFAVSLGISTALVIGPQQDTNITAALRAACSIPPSASSKRPSNLQVTVADDGPAYSQPDAALTVLVAVVDSRTPRIPNMMRTTATVLGVSAGAATAEQLARLAVCAATDGREIAGILVADPEPTDHTTGRVPELPQPLHRQPNRLSGITTEIRR